MTAVDEHGMVVLEVVGREVEEVADRMLRRVVRILEAHGYLPDANVVATTADEVLARGCNVDVP